MFCAVINQSRDDGTFIPLIKAGHVFFAYDIDPDRILFEVGASPLDNPALRATARVAILDMQAGTFTLYA